MATKSATLITAILVVTLLVLGTTCSFALFVFASKPLTQIGGLIATLLGGALLISISKTPENTRRP